MNDEIKVTKTENGYSCKIRTPLITDKELIQIDTFTSEIAKELNEKVLKEKDMIIAQRLIHNLQQRIDQAIEKIKSVRVYGLRSGQTLIATLLNDILDILEGSDKSERKSKTRIIRKSNKT